ncbi:MAG: DUF45 domain-containing protein [Eubacterium sp.]|nr:DUF45 domain-containing protein [Eubacterium sp.]
MYTLEHNGRIIEYDIERKDVKNINLRVKADCTVAVSANNSVPKSVIDDFVSQNADRILRAIRKINRKNSNLPTFESGTRIKLLGTEYALQVNESDKNYYSIGTSKILFFVHNSEIFENREAVYNMLLYDISKRVFPKLLKECYPPFEAYCKGIPELNIKFLKAQWGNCYAGRNLITLNAKLAAYSESVIRSVIYHEYCHFVHQNHSAEYYKVLSSVMPEWKKYERELKK